ncbi:MAG: tRNA pseudouridine(38-40) synthase TruA, partial [Candidatus Helarchaeota archaeon]|nr:tRNA pseudouridine(38-40) synthase TruA [Candidatus Helarchaeota archaeon]
ADYISAGRTDKGVHALGQVVAISTSKKVVLPAINSFLPKNIVVWAIKMVNKKFNPRFDAFSRYYRYYTYYSGEDMNSMRAGARILEGIHDFQLFSKKYPEKNTIRHVDQIRVEKKESFLIFHVTANTFLWQMVRRIVDALLKIGQSQWQLKDLKDLLDLSPDSNIHTRPRPVNGLGSLILWDIEYPFQFQPDIKSLEHVKKILQDYLSEVSLKTYFTKEFNDFFDLLNEKR